MAKTGLKNLIGSCITGFFGIGFLIFCLSSPYWVTATFKLPGVQQESEVNHGLFTGTYIKRFLQQKYTSEIVLTCLYSENVCAWSCKGSAQERFNEVENLYNNNTSGILGCSAASDFNLFLSPIGAIDQGDFLVAGLWVATIFFLSSSIFFNAVAVGFNIWNIFYNPIETYASILGLYIYYGIAACSTLLAIILWGAEFGGYTSNNLALVDTIYNHIEASASIYTSYILLIPAFVEQVVSIAILYHRQYVINKEEAKKVIKIDDNRNNDVNTFMY